MRFLDFTRFDDWAGPMPHTNVYLERCRPRYFSVVRHPVNTCVSGYYFQAEAFGHLRRRSWRRPITIDQIIWHSRVDINDCVEVNAGWMGVKDGSASWLQEVWPMYDACLRNCLIPARQMWAHLCGYEADCRNGDLNNPIDSEAAHKRAKFNAENHYVVIGIVEHMHATLETFELVLPEFFTGALDLYKSLGEKNRAMQTLTAHVPVSDVGHDSSFYIEPSREVRQWLHEQLNDTVGLYMWLQARLFSHQQKALASVGFVGGGNFDRLDNAMPCP